MSAASLVKKVDGTWSQFSDRQTNFLRIRYGCS